jgi:hypothetical protein
MLIRCLGPHAHHPDIHGKRSGLALRLGSLPLEGRDRQNVVGASSAGDADVGEQGHDVFPEGEQGADDAAAAGEMKYRRVRPGLPARRLPRSLRRS